MKSDVFIRCPSCKKRINLSSRLRRIKDIEIIRENKNGILPSEFKAEIDCSFCDVNVLNLILNKVKEK